MIYTPEQQVPESEEHESGVQNFVDYEATNSLEEDLESIAASLGEQPEGVNIFFKNHEADFCRKEVIDGKTFLFTTSDGYTAVALVRSDNDTTWCVRAFRYSGSDDQWKALPAMRCTGSYMKGEEDNPLHHYVQSAKLHKDVYLALDALPRGKASFQEQEFLPRQPGEDNNGVRWGEFEFHEEYESMKDLEWLGYQTFSQQANMLYGELAHAWLVGVDLSLDGKFYAMLREVNVPELNKVAKLIEHINANPDIPADQIEDCHFQNYGFEDTHPDIHSFVELYREQAGKFLERMFRTRMPESMLPNFLEDNIVDRYDKKSKLGNTTHVEEYYLASPSGDELIFAMAYDNLGRVFIDNIYDPNARVSTYGTPEVITQMGHLVYKPEDYPGQTINIPEEYVSDSGNYNDINRFWRNVPIIGAYTQSLVARGVQAVTARLKINGPEMNEILRQKRLKGQLAAELAIEALAAKNKKLAQG